MLVLELLQLAGPTSPFDRVVGWATLPLCDAGMGVVQGRFKLPMLRGEHSPATAQFGDIEATLRSDLGHWLCNVYFEVKRWDLGQWGKVQSSHTQTQSNLWQPLSLELPTPLYATQPSLNSARRGDSVRGCGSSGQSQVPDIAFLENTVKKIEPENTEDTAPIVKKCKKPVRPHPRPRVSFSFASSSGFKVHPDESPTSASAAVLETSSPGLGHICSDFDSKTQPLTRRSSLKRVALQTANIDTDDEHSVIVHSEENPSGDDESSYNVHYSDSSTLASGKFRRQASTRAWSIATHRAAIDNSTDGSNSDSDEDVDDSSQHSKRSSGGRLNMDTNTDTRAFVIHSRNTASALPWTRLVLPTDIALYSPSLLPDPAQRPCLLPHAIASSKLRYVSAEALSDLDWRVCGSFDYCLTLCLYLAAVWTSLYVHYLGQYLFLLVSHYVLYDSTTLLLVDYDMLYHGIYDMSRR